MEPHPESLNSIGGWRFSQQAVGQLEFEVPESGLYTIAFKVSRISGEVASRRVLIDGVVPFAELDAVEFLFHPLPDTPPGGAELT